MRGTISALAIRLLLAWLIFSIDVGAQTSVPSREDERYEYRLLATSKTSTMQKEMNQAADAGFRFEAVMGGKTAFGGSEVVLVMGKPAKMETTPRYQYKLLATSKTSTMQKELQEAADAAFEYVGQSVFKSRFGGDEVVVILERDLEVHTPIRYEYKLLATKKTSTMQKEIRQVSDQGFVVVGLTVSKSKFGGREVITIMRRRVEQ